MQRPQPAGAVVFKGMGERVEREGVHDAQRPLATRVVVRQIQIAVERNALGDEQVVRLVARRVGAHDEIGRSEHGQRESERQ